MCGTGVQMDFKGNDFYLANDKMIFYLANDTCLVGKKSNLLYREQCTVNHIRTLGLVYGTLHFSSRRCKRRIGNFFFTKV